MDGISEVLLVVRQWVPTLMAGKHFSHMVATLCYFNSLNICSTQFRTITIVSIAIHLWEVRMHLSEGMRFGCVMCSLVLVY